MFSIPPGPRKTKVPRDFESTMTAGDRGRVGSVPESKKRLFLKAVSGMASTRGAIKAFCQQCVGYSELPDSVRDCTARVCPLWCYRPHQTKQTKPEETEK